MSLTVRYIDTILALTFIAAPPSFSQFVDDKQGSFAAHIEKAQKYLGEKRPDLAIPELQAAAAIDPENVETQGNLCVLLYFQGKTSEAIPHLRAAVELRAGIAQDSGILVLVAIRTLGLV